MLHAILLVSVFMLFSCNKAVKPEYHFSKSNIEKSVELDYLLYLPVDYEPTRKWPLILYLTGIEAINDIQIIKQHGPPHALEQGLKQDFFLLAPQLPQDMHWDAEALRALLDKIMAEYQIDDKRIWVTGIGDRGGWGAWDIAASYPGMFSKIAPVSAPACTEVCRVGEGEVRIFHGAQDSLVPLEDAQNMLFELDHYCKSDVKLTVYDSLGHDIWDEVYNSEDFWDWFTGGELGSVGETSDPTLGHFSITTNRSVEDNYLLYLPQKYKSSQDSWPLVIFLHGSGSSIEDIEKIRTGGPPQLFETGKDSAFILLAPQLYANVPWDVERVHAMVLEVINEHNVDIRRIYVTGLSRGGFGCWELAVTYPDLFAAVAPISARDIPGVERLKTSNIWIFHGQDDDGVPWQGSQFMYNRLNNAGANVQLSLLEGVGHNAWDYAYSSDEFWSWLLAQKSENNEANDAFN